MKIHSFHVGIGRHTTKAPLPLLNSPRVRARVTGQHQIVGLGVKSHPKSHWASLVAQLVKNVPAMRETCVRSVGWADPLEKGMGSPLQYSGLENSMDYTVRAGHD